MHKQILSEHKQNCFLASDWMGISVSYQHTGHFFLRIHLDMESTWKSPECYNRDQTGTFDHPDIHQYLQRKRENKEKEKVNVTKTRKRSTQFFFFGAKLLYLSSIMVLYSRGSRLMDGCYCCPTERRTEMTDSGGGKQICSPPHRY